VTIHLFIDTNVLLSFFHLSSDDLEELKKLAALIRIGDVALHLPRQVVDEFHRNRSNKIADGLKALRQHKLKMQFPQICKDYPEYQKLTGLQRELEQAHAALIARVESDVRANQLKADVVIRELFGTVTAVAPSSAVLGTAHYRHAVGNPPGKRDSLGDAINWETLLEAVQNMEDLYFVAADQDYVSAFDESQFNEYLAAEWSTKKASKLHFFQRLSTLFRSRVPDIQLASEIEKEHAIARLAASPNFASTHKIVAELGSFSDFTDPQVSAIVRATLANEQILWIITDEDVKAFVEALIARYAKVIDAEDIATLKSKLNPPLPSVPSAPSADDDHPF
jgi:hypothetical protein